MPRDKPQDGRVKEREGVWEEMEGVVCFGTLGPQAGTQERKCSRECNLLKWNERYARVPCVSSRGEMIDWERLQEGGWNVTGECYSWYLKNIPTLFLFMLAIRPTSCPLKPKCNHGNNILTHMESTFAKYIPYQIKWQAESWESCFYEFWDVKKSNEQLVWRGSSLAREHLYVCYKNTSAFLAS